MAGFIVTRQHMIKHVLVCVCWTTRPPSEPIKVININFYINSKLTIFKVMYRTSKIKT